MLATSAYAGYSGCRQYRENLADALAQLAEEGLPALNIDKLRYFYNHPGFVRPMIDATLAALAELPAATRDGARLAFTTHSIPLSMAETSGAPDDPARGTPGGAYVAQHLDVARLIAEAVAEATGVADRPWQLVYQSRSGAPHIPWLEPDICDHLEDVHAEGAPAVVMVPIGFVSDHMEVKYDLDTEAVAKAAELGLPAAARRPWAPTRASPRRCASCCWSARPSSGASRWSAAPSAPSARATTAAPRPAAPTPRPQARSGAGLTLPHLSRRNFVSDQDLLDELLDVALDAARQAGALLRDGRPADLGVAATKSSPVDVVTEMDLASEKLIVELIAERRPRDGYLGEEGAERPSSSGVRWVVDPLDGTVNYLYGLPGWAVSVAAELDGEAVVGVVAAPVRGETFQAVRGAARCWTADRSPAGVRPAGARC